MIISRSTTTQISFFFSIVSDGFICRCPEKSNVWRRPRGVPSSLTFLPRSMDSKSLEPTAKKSSSRIVFTNCRSVDQLIFCKAFGNVASLPLFSLLIYYFCSHSLWFGTTKNPNETTGPLALPFAHSLVLLTHSLAPRCSRALLR